MAISKVSSEGDVYDSIKIFFDQERRNAEKAARAANNGEDPPAYVKQEYPKMLFQKGFNGEVSMTRTVANPDEEAKAGPDFYGHPDEAKAAADSISTKAKK